MITLDPNLVNHKANQTLTRGVFTSALLVCLGVVLLSSAVLPSSSFANHPHMEKPMYEENPEIFKLQEENEALHRKNLEMAKDIKKYKLAIEAYKATIADVTNMETDYDN